MKNNIVIEFDFNTFQKHIPGSRYIILQKKDTNISLHKIIRVYNKHPDYAPYFDRIEQIDFIGNVTNPIQSNPGFYLDTNYSYTFNDLFGGLSIAHEAAVAIIKTNDTLDDSLFYRENNYIKTKEENPNKLIFNVYNNNSYVFYFNKG